MLALVGEVAPRTVEILLSASILILLSPLLLVRGLWSWHQSGSVLVRKRLIGRYQTPFDPRDLFAVSLFG